MVTTEERRQGRKDFQIGMTGFGLAIVWLLLVGGISWWLAVR